MKDMIAGRCWPRVQFRLYFGAMASLIVATVWLDLAWVVGSVLALSALLLGWNPLSATRWLRSVAVDSADALQ